MQDMFFSVIDVFVCGCCVGGMWVVCNWYVDDSFNCSFCIVFIALFSFDVDVNQVQYVVSVWMGLATSLARVSRNDEC